MANEQTSYTCPLAAIDRRLEDVHQQWHQAEQAYFEPEQFRLAIQAAIQTLRTVSFVLQKHKREIPSFEDWYPAWQQRFGNDPLMVWMRDARNRIEKVGDLEANSFVRAEIIASYLNEGPRIEVPARLFDQPWQLIKNIPQNAIGDHVRKNGVLYGEANTGSTRSPTCKTFGARNQGRHPKAGAPPEGAVRIERWYDNVERDLATLHKRVEDTLTQVFGHDTLERKRYNVRGFGVSVPLILGYRTPPPDYAKHFRSGVADGISTLKTAISMLNENLEDLGESPSGQALRAYDGLELHPREWMRPFKAARRWQDVGIQEPR